MMKWLGLKIERYLNFTNISSKTNQVSIYVTNNVYNALLLYILETIDAIRII